LLTVQIFEEFRIIFDKKKGPDGLIAIPTVRLVLQSYWRFIRREGFEANPGPFPEDRLDQVANICIFFTFFFFFFFLIVATQNRCECVWPDIGSVSDGVLPL
jgi:hypothetical protein